MSPLMCAMGKGMIMTSSSENPQCLTIRSTDSDSVAGVWTTNLGWPVVPDVLISTAGLYRAGETDKFASAAPSNSASHGWTPWSSKVPLTTKRLPGARIEPSTGATFS